MINTVKFPMTVNKEVEIVDSCMGTSKTTYMLKWIDSQPNKKFIFVSPLLTEVEEGGRIHKDLNNVVFEEQYPLIDGYTRTGKAVDHTNMKMFIKLYKEKYYE